MTHNDISCRKYLRKNVQFSCFGLLCPQRINENKYLKTKTHQINFNFNLLLLDIRLSWMVVLFVHCFVLYPLASIFRLFSLHFRMLISQFWYLVLSRVPLSQWQLFRRCEIAMLVLLLISIAVAVGVFIPSKAL